MEQYITSRKNPALQRVRRLLTSAKERQSAGLFAGEGTKLLQEAIAHCPGLDTVILSEDVNMDIPGGVTVIRVPRDVLESLSTQDAPQGAIFLCKLPEKTPYVPAPGLVLDGIQDPGNLGTILRTADALDVTVTLLEGCADPWSPKTVRASMGAVFRRQVVRGSWEEVRRGCAEANIPVAVTALREDAQDLRQTDLSRMAVVIGSEGRGVRREVLDQADKTLIIPMNPHCESLNAAVAAAIVMWQMKQTV